MRLLADTLTVGGIIAVIAGLVVGSAPLAILGVVLVLASAGVALARRRRFTRR